MVRKRVVGRLVKVRGDVALVYFELESNSSKYVFAFYFPSSLEVVPADFTFLHTSCVFENPSLSHKILAFGQSLRWM